MAEIFGGFDATTVEPAQAYQCLPAGQYDVIATSMDTYTTSSGMFQAVKMELAVLNGAYQNRKLYVNCLIVSRAPDYTGKLDEKAQTALDIGRGRFSALCRAVNVLTPRDTNELLGKPFRVTVKIKDDSQRGKQNEVKDFLPRNATPAMSQPGSAPTAVPQAAQPPVMAAPF